MKNDASESAGSVCFPIIVNRCVNLFLGLLFLIPSLVIVGILYVVSRLVEKKPRSSFLYSGERLGLNKKVFTIHKIRTLRDDPEFEKQGVILPPDSRRELVLGKFLRDSRLDELPQLWNVICGDMNLVGPRPLRPAIYEKLQSQLANCEGRFRVKPGLTGYSQFFTPSRTPKRLRFAIDNYFINQGYRPGRDLLLIGWTVWMVLVKTVKAVGRRLFDSWAMFKARGKVKEERQTERHRSKNIWIQMADVDFSNGADKAIPIYDINDKAVSFLYEEELNNEEALYFYLIGSKAGDGGRHKRVRCCGYVYRRYPESESSDSATRYVVFYEPVSPRHRYLADHYVLHETVA